MIRPSKAPTNHQQKERLYAAHGEQLQVAVREKCPVNNGFLNVCWLLAAKGYGVVRKVRYTQDVDARDKPGHDELC